MPPGPASHDYLRDIQTATAYFSKAGLLTDPNLYFVLATYLRFSNQLHYPSTSASDRNSIEAVVKWLRDYRAGLVSLPTEPPPPISDSHTKPRGWLDSTANCVISGWTQDEDTPLYPTAVHFYIDGPAGSGLFAGLTAQYIYRSDLCIAIGPCNHGFSWPIPSQFHDGKQHSVYAYGIDTTIADTNNAELSGSPKTFQCN